MESWRGRKLRRRVFDDVPVTMYSRLSNPSKCWKLVGPLILGRECDRFGRVSVERLARDDALAAYSRLLVTHCEICWLTSCPAVGRGAKGFVGETGIAWGCSYMRAADRPSACG